MENIQLALGVGKIYGIGIDMVQLRVESLKDLSVVIDHFNTYPLHTKKQLDFKLFKLALTYIKNKEHFTSEGLEKLIAIKASMNKGLTEELKVLFPNITPAIKPESNIGLSINPQWLAGFISAVPQAGRGCFSVFISESKYTKVGSQVKLRLTQHVRDVELMESLVSYLGGKVTKSREEVDLDVRKISVITCKILPLLDKYPIQGVKYEDYCDFVKVVELMKNKTHLSAEGLSLIHKIKVGMNTGRR